MKIPLSEQSLDDLMASYKVAWRIPIDRMTLIEIEGEMTRRGYDARRALRGEQSIQGPQKRTINIDNLREFLEKLESGAVIKSTQSSIHANPDADTIVYKIKFTNGDLLFIELPRTKEKRVR